MADNEDGPVHWATAINNKLKPYSELADTLQKLAKSAAWFVGIVVLIVTVFSTYITIELPSRDTHLYLALAFQPFILAAVVIHSRNTAARIFKGGWLGISYAAAPILFALATGLSVCFAVEQQTGELRMVWMSNTMIGFLTLGWSVVTLIIDLFHLTLDLLIGGILALVMDLPAIIGRWSTNSSSDEATVVSPQKS